MEFVALVGLANRETRTSGPVTVFRPVKSDDQNSMRSLMLATGSHSDMCGILTAACDNR